MQTNPTAGPTMDTTSLSQIQKNTEVSSDMFLNLLVTQLKNQDPLSPTDNTAFVAQLAQFSSLEGINNLNDSFTGVSDSMDSLASFATAGLIGRNATVEGSSAAFQGTPVALGYELKDPANSVTLTVYDRDGRMVSTATEKDVTAGTHEFICDGTGADGAALPTGAYDFTLTTGTGTDNEAALPTYVGGTVEGVDLSGPEPLIVMNGILYPASGIQEVF